MASGVGSFGLEGRCYKFYVGMARCVNQAPHAEVCRIHKADFDECLRKTKEKNRIAAIANQQRRMVERAGQVAAVEKGSDKVGLAIRPDGFAKLTDIAALDEMQGMDLSVGTVEAIVANCKKQRFALKEIDGQLHLRANQGHTIASVDADALLTRLEDPTEVPEALHGTYLAAWEHIRDGGGLHRMARNHIHLADGPEAVSGMRGDVQVEIYVDVAAAMEAGIPFFLSANGVILTPGMQGGGLPSQFFTRVIERRTGTPLPFEPQAAVRAPDPALVQAGVRASRGNKSQRGGKGGRGGDRGGRSGAAGAGKAGGRRGGQPAAAAAAAGTEAEYDFICVLDFEATCQKGPRISPQEVIEFPSVLVSTGRGGTGAPCVVAEFQQYVRPVHHPQLTPFCTELTGIDQRTVYEHGVDFATALRRWTGWLRHHVYGAACPAAEDAGVPLGKASAPAAAAAAAGAAAASAGAPGKRVLVLTCGDWDLKTMLPQQLECARPPVPKGAPPPELQSWCNLKHAFQSAFRGRPVRGMTDMLDRMQLPLVGRHHSGVDDCRNCAAIVLQLLRTPAGRAALVVTRSTKGGKRGRR